MPSKLRLGAFEICEVMKPDGPLNAPRYLRSLRNTSSLFEYSPWTVTLSRPSKKFLPATPLMNLLARSP